MKAHLGKYSLERKTIALRNSLSAALFISLALCLFMKAGPVTAAEKLRLANSGFNTSSMPEYIGREEGIYLREGIDLEILVVRPDLAAAAVTAGQIDTTVFVATALLARAKGLPVVTIFNDDSYSRFFLMAQPSIRFVRDLAGKNVLLFTMGGAPYIETLKVLKSSGVNPRDVLLTAMDGGSEKLYSVLLAGGAAAVLLTPPFNFKAEAQGFRRLAFSGDYAPAATVGLVVHEKSLKLKREVLKKLIRGRLKSLQYIRDHPERDIQWLIRHMGISRGLAEASLRWQLRIWNKDGRASEEAILNPLRLGVEMGVYDPNRDFRINPTPGQLVDYSLLKEVLKEMK